MVILDVNEPRKTDWKHPERVKFMAIDITEVANIESAVTDAVKWIADTGAPLGGIINCAGVGVVGKISDPRSGPHSLDLWNFVVGINLTATFNLTRLFTQELLKVSPSDEDGERGVVIMVASSAAFEGQQGQTAYAATKGAILSMTLPMARDLGRHGIRVNTIAPSIFESPMTKRMSDKVKKSLESELQFPHRFGQAWEFANTVKWILETPFVNGDVFRLSGGSRMPAKM